MVWSYFVDSIMEAVKATSIQMYDHLPITLAVHPRQMYGGRKLAWAGLPGHFVWSPATTRNKILFSASSASAAMWWSRRRAPVSWMLVVAPGWMVARWLNNIRYGVFQSPSYGNEHARAPCPRSEAGLLIDLGLVRLQRWRPVTIIRSRNPPIMALSATARR